LSLATAKRGLVPHIHDDGSVVVHTENPQALAPDLLRGLLADGLDVYTSEPVEASLEDVFLELATAVLVRLGWLTFERYLA
jgi:hypothetical protein